MLNFRIEIDSDETGERDRIVYKTLQAASSIWKGLAQGSSASQGCFSSVALGLSIDWKEETRLMAEKPIWSLFILQIKSPGLD